MSIFGSVARASASVNALAPYLAANASAFGANAAQILSFNNAEVKGLTPGMKIIVPDGVKKDAPKPAPAAAVSRGLVAGAATTGAAATRDVSTD